MESLPQDKEYQLCRSTSQSMVICKEKGTDIMVPGVIEKVQFCGAYTEYLVKVEDGNLKIIELNHWDGSNIKQCGEHVFVGCR